MNILTYLIPYILVIIAFGSVAHPTDMPLPALPGLLYSDCVRTSSDIGHWTTDVLVTRDDGHTQIFPPADPSYPLCLDQPGLGHSYTIEAANYPSGVLFTFKRVINYDMDDDGRYGYGDLTAVFQAYGFAGFGEFAQRFAECAGEFYAVDCPQPE